MAQPGRTSESQSLPDKHLWLSSYAKEELSLICLHYIIQLALPEIQTPGDAAAGLCLVVTVSCGASPPTPGEVAVQS